MKTSLICSDTRVGRFEKRLAGRGGWREEILPVPEIQTQRFRPLFCTLFPMPPLEKGEHHSGNEFSRYFGARSSPTPSRQPLFETSECDGSVKTGAIKDPHHPFSKYLLDTPSKYLLVRFQSLGSTFSGVSGLPLRNLSRTSKHLRHAIQGHPNLWNSSMGASWGRSICCNVLPLAAKRLLNDPPSGKHYAISSSK